LFVSLADMQDLIEGLLGRGYRFTPVDDPGDKTVTITFDDGYYNNLLFSGLAQQYQIPYVLFVSTYYTQSGEGFPWLKAGAQSYAQMYQFDYYTHHQEASGRPSPPRDTSPHRPLTFDELSKLASLGLAEIGCHGHYHQPLSKGFETFLGQEMSSALSALDSELGAKPRYYALANGMYTGPVVRELLKTFTKVFTIDGLPYRAKDRVVHRISLTSPSVSASLIEQIDTATFFPRRVKRNLRTRRRLHS
jgi:peptidoglycan/xylan/chitin deacetylase (PgdA/CDA1 family)